MAYTTDCYWTRLRGFQSGLDDLIATNIGSGFRVVTIGRRDAGFDSVSCGPWTSDLSPVLDPSSGEFGEGTYIVGTDIEPGEYIAGDSQSCVWMRLAGFGFTRRQVLARAFVRGGSLPRVTILDTDVGFSSGGCGTWTRVDPAS